MPIDHFSIKVPKNKFDEVVDFYAKVLASLGYIKGPGFPGVISMLVDGYPDFWIMAKEEKSECDGHFAFKCKGKSCIICSHWRESNRNDDTFFHYAVSLPWDLPTCCLFLFLSLANYYITDRTTVKKVYEDSLSVGGKGNGEPGLRKGYLPTYFSAYFFDPVENNVEAVTVSAE